MNTCVVLGAGASLANALHFRSERMRDTRPPLDTTFFETVDLQRITLSAALRSYFTDFLGIEPTATTLRELRMEEVFKDVFYDFQETPSNKTALNAYIDLVELYLRVLRATTNWLCALNREGGPVGRLLGAAAVASNDLTILTFNHDLVIENEINRRARLRERWCLDAGYGDLSSSLIPARPTRGGPPVFPLHRDGLCDHSRPLRLLKLHGSLNWVVKLSTSRPTANLLGGRGRSRDIHLVTRRQILGRGSLVRTGPGRTRWRTWPVVVPPVYAKLALRQAVQDAWSEARSRLEAADRVVFFGYSLPEIDVEAEKLFERSLTKNKTVGWIDVINPATGSPARFAGVSGRTPVRWYPSLRAFTQAGGFT